MVNVTFFLLTVISSVMSTKQAYQIRKLKRRCLIPCKLFLKPPINCVNSQGLNDLPMKSAKQDLNILVPPHQIIISDSCFILTVGILLPMGKWIAFSYL